MNQEEIEFKKIFSDKNDNEKTLNKVYEYILIQLKLNDINN